MKYIRTKDGRIIDTTKIATGSKYMDFATNDESFREIFKTEPLAKSDTIEELCDAIVRIRQDKYPLAFNLVLRTIWESKGVWLDWCKRYIERIVESVDGIGLYGAIWTDKGLIYVAEMNEDGCLTLL